ncbi:MAG: efflux RND transporter periplasmic adaptor subunit [Myxococcales bacterium]|nr:efflux RND transporter periplasmic adaptor subunit [Myxococcales bacterium]
MKRDWIVCVALGAALLGGCPHRDAATESDTRVSPPGDAAQASKLDNPVAATTDVRSLAWAQVTVGDGALLWEVPAQSIGSAQQRGEVMPAFRAQVLQVLVEPGQTVAVGEPLVVVRMPEVLRAAGAYVAAGLRISAHTQRREQLASLRSEGLARLSDLAEVQATLAEAQAAQKEAQAVLAAAGVSASDAPSLCEGSGRVTLRSPIAGVVTTVTAALGQLVEPGGTALAKLSGQGSSRIEARLPDTSTLQLRYDWLLSDGKTISLRQLSRAPMFDPRDGMAQTWLVPTKSEPIAAGLSGRLRVLLDKSPSDGRLWLLPARALRLGDGQVTVLRQRDGQRKTVTVKVVASAGGKALISATDERELVLGDRVALEPSLSESTGDKP